MSNYLLLFTIGPVQSFIAQARKTHDLYAGSKLLSDLIGYALKKTIGDYSAEPIFPFINKEELNSKEERSYPNRFLVSLRINNDAPEQIGNAIEKEVKEKLVSISKDYIKDEYEGEKRILGVKEQIKDFLEVYWVMIPLKIEGKQTSYEEAFKAAERLLGAVKNVRPFKQLHYQIGKDGKIIDGEVGRKCSLDGQYNVKFYRKTESEKDEQRLLDKKLFIAEKQEIMLVEYNDDLKIKKSQLQPGEGLSAISMLKRLYDRDNIERFESTAGICLMQSLLPFEKNIELNCKNQNFKNAVKNIIGHFDEQMYFEENHSESYLLKHGANKPIKKDLLQSFQICYSEIKNKLFNDQSQDNFKYYAILTFDGDSMGKWLAGDNLKDEYRKGDKLKEFHTRLSKLLSEFANHARENILHPEDGSGRTVYAGGDDFLGFVNLYHLFDVVEKLRSDFDRLVNNELSTYKQPGKHLTFSAGIVIAHYKLPLSEALKKAREAEKRAKNEGQGNRNAFALAVMKHSGEMQECVFKWDTSSSEASASSNWKDMEIIFKLLNEEVFSNKFITNLTIEIYDLAGLSLDKIDTSTNLSTQIESGVKVEMQRLIKRALKKRIDEKNDKENIDKMCSAVLRLWSNAEVRDDKRKMIKQTENFIHALHIIDFIQRKI